MVACLLCSAFSANATEESSFSNLPHEKRLTQKEIDDYLYWQKWKSLKSQGIVNDKITLTRDRGIYNENGKTEKFYSSLVLVHKDIETFWLDHEGFWHDQAGYYVVASEDYDDGDVFAVSKGLACKHDCGCDTGIVDFYTNWES